MSPQRLIHTLGVEETAIKLAQKYGGPIRSAQVAALLHDCSKDLPGKVLLKKAQDSGIIFGEVEANYPDLLHGPVGSVVAKEEYGVADFFILHAISVHTTGCPRMTLLDKIIYIADYIEPNRDFPGVDDLRNLAWRDLDKCLMLSFNRTLFYLIEGGKPIHQNTFAARNWLLLHGKG